MRSKIIETHKKTLSLSQTQREIIIGLLLGDGHLETQNNGQTYRLKIEHSVKQKVYTDWLYMIFSEWCNQPPKARIKKSFNKDIVSYGFTTYSSSALRFYGQQFYLGKKKVIPKIIKKLLSPQSLAIWFMDDGSWKSDHHKTYIIHALGYKKPELALIKKTLKEKFGININIHKQYDKWRIYIMSDSSEKFKMLIKSYVIPEMFYKLG